MEYAENYQKSKNIIVFFRGIYFLGDGFLTRFSERFQWSLRGFPAGAEIPRVRVPGGIPVVRVPAGIPVVRVPKRHAHTDTKTQTQLQRHAQTDTKTNSETQRHTFRHKDTHTGSQPASGLIQLATNLGRFAGSGCYRHEHSHACGVCMPLTHC